MAGPRNSFTPVLLTTPDYAAGQCLGSVSFELTMPHGRRGKITTIVAKDKDNIGPALKCLFFSQEPEAAGATIDQQGAFVWGNSWASYLCTAKVAGINYDTTDSRKSATLANQGILLDADKVWVVFLADGAYNVASADGLTIDIGLEAMNA